MQEIIYKTQKGKTVELSVLDLQQIHKHYMVQNLADYIRENNPKWREDKVQDISYMAYDFINKYGYDEHIAIQEAIEKYKKVQ